MSASDCKLSKGHHGNSEQDLLQAREHSLVGTRTLTRYICCKHLEKVCKKDDGKKIKIKKHWQESMYKTRDTGSEAGGLLQVQGQPAAHSRCWVSLTTQ